MPRLRPRVPIVLLLLACGPTLLPDEAWGDKDAAAARALFERAEGRFSRGQYEEALRLYLQAYRKKPLAGFHFNIGQCYRKLDRCDKAIEHFERYVAGARNLANRVTAEELIGECQEELRRQRGFAGVADDRTAPPDAESYEQRADEGASASELPTLRTTPTPDPDDEGDAGLRLLDPAWFWSGLGVTAAFGLTTLVTGLLTIKYGSDYDDRATPANDLPGIKETGERLRTTANVGLGLGLAAAAATTVLFLLTDWHGSPVEVEASTASGRRAFALKGRF